ncbi:MAG: hypothetical protein APF80_09950 [Alphaproteobacteria bacterium BRH_c36]|nr:MAG: hypothetical protein APF80_09950 [Alphaproteobacteria bacterium BRH_c36]
MKRPITFAAVTTATALFTAGTAFADCKDDLNNLPRNFTDRVAEDGNLSSRQVNRLHAAAKILSRAGYEDACAELVDVLSGDAASSQSASGSQRAGGGKQTASRDTDPEMMQKAEAARPVMDKEGRFSSNGMIGSEVYSAETGEAVGDIEDILMGKDKNFVIIGHGGLLGMGEKRIQVSLQDLSVYPRDNTFFVDLTNQEIENAQAVVKKDNRWVAKAGAGGRQSNAADDERDTQRLAERDSDESRQSNDRSTGERIADRASKTMQSAQRSAERLVDDDRSAARNQNRSDRVSAQKLSSRSDFSANELIGSWVYASGSAERVGEIEDFIVTPSGGNSSVVLGHGGFLGLGEKRIKIDVGDIRYDQSDDRYYVDFSEEELKNAPAVKKVNDQWVGKSLGQSSSDTSNTDANQTK